jgi:LmbE family N-acetylglucosaminyl deacetylase
VESSQARVLGIFSHPDDAEIWAGGTLLAHRARGDETAVCILTHGDDSRAEEARHGADLLQARLVHLRFRDRGLSLARDAAVEAVAGVLVQERPNIVITHWREDSHSDHRAAWEIAEAAIVLAEAENDLAAIISCDTYNGAGISGRLAPKYLVDVSEMWDQKIAAIMAHASQGPEHYCAMIARQCALHGAAGGVTFAEGFVRVPLFGKAQSARPSLWDFI